MKNWETERDGGREKTEIAFLHLLIFNDQINTGVFVYERFARQSAIGNPFGLRFEYTPNFVR